LDNIINLYDCDVFTVVSLDSNSKDINLIKQTKCLVIDNEPKHDEKDYLFYKAKRTNKYTIQGWLSQFWKIKICHQLMLDYQKEKSISYDWVIRCRPDLMITRKIDDLNGFNKDYIYVPVFPVGPKLNKEEYYKDDYVYNYVDNKCYLPEQFAIGSVDLMSIYAKRYDDLDMIIHAEKIKHFCSEFSIARQLKWYNVKVKFIRPLLGIQRESKLVING
jgi:hypothetical protein